MVGITVAMIWIWIIAAKPSLSMDQAARQQSILHNASYQDLFVGCRVCGPLQKSLMPAKIPTIFYAY